MATNDKQGIDYGRGITNVDKDNGIRFGVISQRSLADYFVYEDFEADYGKPTCPVCGNTVADSSTDIGCGEDCNKEDEHDADCTYTLGDNPTLCGCLDRCDCDDLPAYSSHGCVDYVCIVCRHTLDSSEVYGDEPQAYGLKDSEYLAHYDNSGFGVWVEKSPYYTYAEFCSPCAPGAGDLNNAIVDCNVSLGHGNPCRDLGQHGLDKVYCFGHDCFDDGVAPYRVFRVSDNIEVYPNETSSYNIENGITGR